MAYSNLLPPWTLRPCHKRPMIVRGTMNSNRHALRAALSRQSLANPCAHEERLKFCHAGPEMSRARSSADDWLARLFQYLKEVRRQGCIVQHVIGALLLPRALAAACALLSECCCARHRTVRAAPLEPAHHPGRYPHRLFELRTETCGSCAPGAAVRSAGATRAAGRVC